VSGGVERESQLSQERCATANNNVRLYTRAACCNATNRRDISRDHIGLSAHLRAPSHHVFLHNNKGRLHSVMSSRA
jgi:hypothetical protein